jgi:hypothetical protein
MNKTNPPKSWFQRVMGKVRIETPRITSNGIVRNDQAKGKLPRRVAKPMQPVSSATRRSPVVGRKPGAADGRKPKA